MTEQQLIYYQHLGLPVTPLTQVGQYHAGAVLLGPTELGSGAFNTTYSVTYRLADGSTVDRVFKPLANGEMVRAAELGISWQPRIANRNLATRIAADMLGFKVIPEIDIGTCRKSGATILGLVMSRAQGRTAHDCPDAFENVNVIREVYKLQLCDHLTAQIDRHTTNYFIEVLPDGRAIVTGIDLHNSFSPKIKDPNTIAFGESRLQSAFRGTLMPQVIDSEMADSVRKLDIDELSQRLLELLSPEEVGAMRARHKAMLAHISQLQANGLIINPTQWSEPWVREFITPETSYVGVARKVDWDGVTSGGAALQAQLRLPPLETKEPPQTDGPVHRALREGDVAAVQTQVSGILQHNPSPQARFDALSALLESAGRVHPASMIKLLRLVANTVAERDEILTKEHRRQLFLRCDERREPHHTLLQEMMVTCSADQVDDLHAIVKGFVIAGASLTCLTWQGGRHTALARTLDTPGANALAAAAVMCGLLSAPAEGMPLHQLGMSSAAMKERLEGLPQGKAWKDKLTAAVEVHGRQLQTMLRHSGPNPATVLAQMTWALQEGQGELAMRLFELHFKERIGRHVGLFNGKAMATPLLTVMTGPNPEPLLAARMVEKALECAGGAPEADAVLRSMGLPLEDLFKALARGKRGMGDEESVGDSHRGPKAKMGHILDMLQDLRVTGVDISKLTVVWKKAP